MHDSFLVLITLLNAMFLLFNIGVTIYGYKTYCNVICDLLLKSSQQSQQSQFNHTELEQPDRSVSKAVVKNTKLAELPPEIIAPVILKPPKPAGGFGSKVTER